jgi:dihydroorotate dehydrogenase (fumarate)
VTTADGALGVSPATRLAPGPATAVQPTGVDLSTQYLGLSLASPIVASASPLTGDPDALRRLGEAGVGAVVLPSLFEEEVLAEEAGFAAALEQESGVFHEALDYFPDLAAEKGVADRYLANLERAEGELEAPLIASLNATSSGGWTRYARLLGRAGADALELNVYFVAADASRSAADIEAEQLQLVSEVCGDAGVAVAVKLSPFYTALANFASSVARAGANGLVLFNRFYQPDIDLDNMSLLSRVSMSRSADLGLPLRWAAILRQLREVLKEHDYRSVSDLRGSVPAASAGDPAASAGDPEALERVNYMKTLRSFELPGRCAGRS